MAATAAECLDGNIDGNIDATLRSGRSAAMMCPPGLGHDRRQTPRRALALLVLCARATTALRDGCT
jgi:hypothetical protein